MNAFRYDSREFESTYFALRLGMMFAAVLVMIAPVAVWITQRTVPPSISDSWYTSAGIVFVLGLGGASVLLLVVRGDTLTEQTLLNVAGGLGLVVAAAACWPKDENGERLPAYDPAVVQSSQHSVGALVVLAALVWTVARVLPGDLVGAGWHIHRGPKLFLQSLYPILILTVAALMMVNAEWLVSHIHGPAAVAMFALLGAVSLLRTSAGLKLLKRIGDTPVDDSLSDSHQENSGTRSDQTKRFDAAYTSIACLMIGVVIAAVMLHLTDAPPGWVLAIEAMLLVLFGIFWGLQTAEAWAERRHRQLLLAAQQQA